MPMSSSRCKLKRSFLGAAGSLKTLDKELSKAYPLMRKVLFLPKGC